MKSVSLIGKLALVLAASVSLATAPDVSYAKNNGKSEIAGGKKSAGGVGIGSAKPEGHASELKKLNGVINANDNAIENASDNSVHGIARTYRDSVRLVESLESEVESLDQQIASLGEEITIEDIDAEIAQLDATSATYEEDLANLEEQKAGLRSQSAIDAEIAVLEAEKTGLLGEIQQAQLDADAALSKLTKDRPLSDGAFQKFLAKLGL